MSLLVIDAGNSKVKLVRWTSNAPLPDFQTNGFFPGQSTDQPSVLGSIPTELLKNPSEFSSQIQKLTDGKENSQVLVSVVPDANIVLQGILPDLKAVANAGAYPFPHTIKQSHTVGPDRFCNMAAAVGAGLKTALVVDAGTATTFDLLLDGVFQGGLIAPGMAFAASQLAKQGAMLEEAAFEERSAVVGCDSAEAMKGGAWLTGVGGVQWAIARLMETYGEFPVILTGGLSRYLVSEDRYQDPFWTLRGAGFLAGVSSA